MSETKWKKNINFDEKKEDIAETSITEGLENADDKTSDEIAEIEKKIRRINNKKKGFTKLPHLESVYDVEPTIESFKEGARSKKKTKPAKTAAPVRDLPTPEQQRQPGKKKPSIMKKVTDALIYISTLPYNLALLIAGGVYWLGNGKRPMSKDDSDYKNLTSMVHRVLTGLIGIFITYNLYFLYSSPELPGFIASILKPKSPANEAIPDPADFLKYVLPLKIALSPLKIFMYIFEHSHPLIQKIPSKALLFITCGVLTYYFLTKGASEYFSKMFGNSFKLFTDPKSYKVNETTTIIILIATIYEVCHLIVEYKTAVFADPRLILGWIVLFGVSCLLVFIAEFIIPLFVFYITFLCIMDNKVNFINFIQTILDINKSFVGENDDIYECPIGGTEMEKFIFRSNKFFGRLLENLHILILVPIIIYNIHNSRYDKSEGFTEGARFSTGSGVGKGLGPIPGTGNTPLKSPGLRTMHSGIGVASICILLLTNKYFVDIMTILFSQPSEL
jgi:hypothetical protein